MNSIYGQNDNLGVQNGMIPYAAPMVGMAAGGDSLGQIAWRGKWLILLSTILGLGGAYGYYRTIGKEYTGTSRVLVEKPSAQRPIDFLQPGTTAANYLQQQASIILSRDIIEKALTDPNLLLLPALNVGNRVQDALRTLSAKVGKDDIINVTVSSEQPEEPAAIVNAVVGAYIKWHEANRRLGTADLYRSLSTKLEDTKKELLSKRQTLQTFAERSSAQGGAQGSLNSKMLDTFRQELTAARLRAIQQKSYYDRLVSLESDPNGLRQYILGQGFSAQDGERARLADALYKTRLQLEEITAKGTVQKSQITLLENREKELVQEIAESDKKFTQERIAIAKALSEDASARELRLENLCKEELDKLQKASGQDSAYELRRLECQMLEDLYNTLLSKIASLDLNNAQMEGLSIHVLEKALPGVEAPSQMARVMGIGLVLGLMVGGGLAFVRDWRDQRVRSADEITAILGVPILGAVPTIPRRGIIRRGPRVRLASHTREFEAYRSIRTALFFGTVRDEAKTLLVTSPGPLEGKTTLVSNLGIAMARAGQKTLIIDADLRKPMQHRVFAKKGHGKGLVDVLAGTAALEEAIRPTEVQGLDVLESGQIVPNPSELLGGDTFRVVFEQLKSRYDRILVDSPPVGIVADAQILATRCGLTLLVLRAQKSSRVVTQRARDALSTVSARVVGAIVNDVPKGDTRYSHHASGAYSYYHGNHASDGRAAPKELPANVGPRSESDESIPEERN